MAEFLFEIGLEEVPARMIAGAEVELREHVVKMLGRERLVAAGAASKSFATPRRLAVWVDGVAERQEDVAEELVGPSVKVAYKDGVPTPAAVAFAKKAGVEVAALKTVTTPKGEYLAATAVKTGRAASEVIAAELPKELAGIYWAKNMRWIPGRPDRFVRPVRWMVALLGSSVVPVSFGGYEAGAVTYGHRVLFGEQAIALKGAGDYEGTLGKAFVVADVETRRQKIRKALDAVTRTVPGARWREDEELVETVTQLTEWPSVILGGFEQEYLALPEEVLVTVMRDHQKYFAVEDKDGKLAPHFLTVLNTEADAAGAPVIRHGNERVLRARFNDAQFFWEFDQRTPLIERVKLLENVTFQKDLGSYAKKTEANVRLATTLADACGDVDVVREATSLAKTDLTCELVKEFTELQGIIGGLYAREQGKSEAVADAIYWQYMPASMEDKIPPRIEAQVLGLADRFTTIVQMFGIGLQPTGSRDPFALRRAGNGVVRLLAESSLPLTLEILIQSITLTESDDLVEIFPGELDRDIKRFFNERVAFYLRDARRFSRGVVNGVMGAHGSPVNAFTNVATESIVTRYGERYISDVRDAVLRAEALTEVSGSEDFADVAAAFKRTKKILVQAKERQESIPDIVSRELLIEPAEKELYEKAAAAAIEVEKYRGRHTKEGYLEALRQIAALRLQVDAFFDAVMVMAPEKELRANRLALLQWLLGSFFRIADFSEIVAV